jgi:hypothetical protein
MSTCVFHFQQELILKMMVSRKDNPQPDLPGLLKMESRSGFRSAAGGGWQMFTNFFDRSRAKPAQPGWQSEHQLRSGFLGLAENGGISRWHGPCLVGFAINGQRACVVPRPGKIKKSNHERKIQ